MSGAAERWRRLAADVEDRAAADEARSPGRSNAHLSGVELLVDDENLAIGDGDALVGASIADEVAGDGGQRGLRLRISGAGAAVVRDARGEIGAEGS